MSNSPQSWATSGSWGLLPGWIHGATSSYHGSGSGVRSVGACSGGGMSLGSGDETNQRAGDSMGWTAAGNGASKVCICTAQMLLAPPGADDHVYQDTGIPDSAAGHTALAIPPNFQYLARLPYVRYPFTTETQIFAMNKELQWFSFTNFMSIFKP